jgi:hypothetical protein
MSSATTTQSPNTATVANASEHANIQLGTPIQESEIGFNSILQFLESGEDLY